MHEHATLNRCFDIACSAARGAVGVARAMLGTLLALFGGQLLAQTPASTALPTGAQVVSGAGTVQQMGTQLTVQQASDKLITNWQSFNIGANATVRFNQPGAASVALNRVLSNDPSAIFGTLQSNGQVFLVNPSGVLFGASARVDVGGLVASSLQLADADFLAGRYRFGGPATSGAVGNEGRIGAAQGGYLAFIAPRVHNSGSLNAPQGSVALGAGEQVSLDFAGDKLLRFSVDQGTVAALVDNQGLIQASGGSVVLSARAADAVTRAVVNQGGVVDASSLVAKGGRIVLEGDEITLKAGSRTDATGATGGGAVLVGGDWQGVGPMRQATTVTMDASASIDASAIHNGDGGTVVLWSDLRKAESLTTAPGSVLARGGVQGGNGGRVETSASTVDIAGFRVDTLAPQGQAGLWLIDPFDYNINAAQATTISNALANTNVEVTTSSNVASYGSNNNNSSNGDINVNSSITKAWSTASTTLTLSAARHIRLGPNATISTELGALNVSLQADTDNNGDGIIFIEGAGISTNGGNLTFGGAGRTANIGGATVRVGGDVFFQRGSEQILNTNGGAFNIWGETIVSNTFGLIVISGNGNVTFNGLLNSGNGYSFQSRTSGGNWDDARIQARAGGFGSAVNDSYLVTITSRLENSIAGLAANYQGAWIGAYRANTNNYAWSWADGPEAGQTFFIQSGSGGVGGGTATAGFYANFAPGEPNGNLDGNRNNTESAGQFFGSAGRWNDLPFYFGYNAQPGSEYNIAGFVRETNLAASPVSINAGAGTVTFTAGVGGSKALASLLVISGALNATSIQANGLIDIRNSGTGLITGVISGAAASLIKGESGTLGLSGANTYTGATTINAGTLNVTGSLSDSTAVTVASGATYALGASDTIGSLAGAGNVTLGSFTSTVGSDNTSTTFNGVMSGTGALVKQGTGIFTLTGANTYTGATTINNGAVTVGNGGPTGTLGGGAVNLIGNLSFNRSDTFTVTNAISGGGELTKIGAGTLILTGANNYGLTRIIAGTLQIGNGGTTGTLGSNQVDNGSVLAFNRSNDLTVNNYIFGPGSLNKSGSGTLTLTSNNGYGGATTIADGTLVLSNNAPNPTTNKSFNGTGQLRIEPAATSFTSSFSTAGWTFANTLTGLTLGKVGNLSGITIGSAQSIAGPINIRGGNIAVDAGLTATGTHTVTLQGSGTVTDGASGFVVADNLLLLGGTVTLDAASNNVGTLAASGVGGLSYTDSNALTLGTVGATNGVAATGVVNIGTTTGDLTVAQSLSTTNTTASALVLNAGISSAAGTATGSNILVSGSPSVSVGTGGRATLYSGGTAASTGLTALVGSGAGRFRYFSDESTTNYTLALSTGLNAIYRERPTVTVAVDNQTAIYGSTPTWAFTLGNGQNGDTVGQAFGTLPTVTVGGGVSTSGRTVAGSHALTAAGGSGSSQLGYSHGGYTAGTLTVTAKTLAVTYTGVNRSYDGSTTATVSTSDDRLASDVLTVARSANFADKNAANGSAVAVTGASLSGADAGNYSIAATGSTTAHITPKALSIDNATVVAGKVYDGATLASVTATGTVSGLVGSETLGVTPSANFTTAAAGSGNKSATVVYTLANGSNGGLAANYSLANETKTGLTISPKALSLTGLVVANKTYDRSTTGSVNSFGSLSGTVGSDVVTLNSSSAAAAFANWNVGNNKTVTVSGLALSGAAAGNYSIANQAGTANIFPKALTISGISASNKVYDASASATVNTGSAVLSGLVFGDSADVTITAASGSFDTKNVGSGKTVTLTYTKGGSALGNYTITDQASTTANITPATLMLLGSTSGVGKTYDGNASLAPSGVSGYGTLTGVLGSDSVSLSGAAAFNGKDVARDGSNNVTAQSVVQGTLALAGTDAGNYSLSWTNGSGTIDPAALTVRANDDADLFTQHDTRAVSNYRGVGYTGLVNGETSAALGGTLVVARDNFGTDGAAAYANVLTPSGLTSSNYNITFAKGDYTIVGANQLLVDVVSQNLTYGAAPTYTVTGAKYLAIDLSTISTPTVTANGGNSFSVDGVTFTVAAAGTSNSGAGKTVVGNYQLGGTVSSGSSGNFNNTLVATGAVQINQAGLIANATGTTKTYDGTAAMNDLQLWLPMAETNDVVSAAGTGSFANKNASAVNGRAYTISNSALSGADAGNYFLWDGSNPVTSLTGNGTVNQATLNVSYIGVNKVYDRLAGATVTTSDNRIAGDSLGINRGAEFADVGGVVGTAKNVGNAKTIDVSGVSLTGTDAGNYIVATTGTATANITPKALVISGITALDKTYNGLTAATLDTSTNLQRSGMIGGDDVTVSATGVFASANAASNQAVTITSSYGGDSGNYSITGQTGAIASITPRPVAVSAAGGVSKTYDGTVGMNNVSIGLGAVGGVAESGVISADNSAAALSVSGLGSFSSANVSRDGNGNVLSDKGYTLSNLQLTGTAAGNYVISGGASSVSGSNGRIDPAALNVSGNSATGTYTGLLQSVGGFTVSGLQGSDTVASLSGVSASGASSTHAGSSTNTVTAGAQNNYTVSTVNGMLMINKANATVTANSDGSKVYNGATQSVSGFMAAGLVNGETTSVLTGVTAGGSGTNAGSYASTASGTDGNYTLTFVNGNLVIAKAGLMATGNSATGTYTGLSQSLGGFTLSGLQGSDTAASLSTVLASGAARINAGTATNIVTAGTEANYTVSSVNGTLTINKANATVTANSDSNKVYNGAAQSVSGFTATGLVNGETTAALSGVTAGGSGTNAGTSASTASGTDGNYTLTFVNGSLVIAKAALTATGNSATGTYTGLAQSVGGFTLSGLQGSDTAASLSTLVASGATRTNAGTATNTVNAGTEANYTISTANGVLTINKAVATVTANSDTGKVYNGASQSVSGFTAAGLVNGETNAVLSGVTAGASDTNAGSYASTAGGTDGNYTLTFVNGSLVIAKAALTATGNSATGTYTGVAQSAIGFTVSGLQGSDNVGSLNNVVASGATRTHAGTATNTVTAGAQTNYTVSTVNGMLTINKANATVTANSDTGRVYNGAVQSVTGFTATGLVNGETTTVLSGVTAGGSGTNAGTYASTASGTDGNYTLTFVNGSLVIAKAALTATGNSATGTYSGLAQSVGGFTLSGLQGSDTAASLNNVVASGATRTNAGTATNTVTAGTEANYTVSTANGLLTINKANATVTANSDTSKVYNGVAQTVSGFTATGLVNGETTAVLSGVTAGASGTNAGSYVSTAAGTDGNYTLTFVNGSLVIAKAALTVTPDAQTRVYGQANSGFTQTLTGFVNGETASSAGVTGTASGSSAASTTTPVGTAAISGGTGSLVANNYTFSAANGTLTITPAPLTVVLVGDVGKVYDGNTGATLAAANYLLSGWVAGEGAGVTQTAGLFADKNAGSAKNVSVMLAGADFSANSGTLLSNYSLPTSAAGAVGQITPATLSAVTGLTAFGKVYDGNTTATLDSSGAAFTGKVAGDVLTLAAASGNFSDKNVGAGKAVNVTGLSLGGADAGNYRLATPSASTTASISRLASVTWVGGASGNWFDPANWAGGAVPDLANVSQVLIPAGVTITFGDTVVAPAERGAVQIDRLGTLGSLDITAGTLNVGTGGVELARLAQSGGTLTSAADLRVGTLSQSGGSTAVQGALTVTEDFEQGSNGSITVRGSVDITDTRGGTVLGNLNSGGPLTVRSLDGDVRQAAGSTLVAQGTASFNARTAGGLPADVILAEAANDFAGRVDISARNAELTDRNGLALSRFTVTGNLGLNSTGNLDLGQGSVGGRLLARSGGGDVTQTSALEVSEGTDIAAGAGRINLGRPDNRLGGQVQLAASGGVTVLGAASAAANAAANAATQTLTQGAAARGGATGSTGSPGGVSGAMAQREAARPVSVSVGDVPEAGEVQGRVLFALADAAGRDVEYEAELVGTTLRIKARSPDTAVAASSAPRERVMEAALRALETQLALPRSRVAVAYLAF